MISKIPLSYIKDKKPEDEILYYFDVWIVASQAQQTLKILILDCCVLSWTLFVAACQKGSEKNYNVE